MNRIFIINPKGGSGKSTMAIHTAIGLLNLGYKVLFIDSDVDQLTGYNFFNNRKNFIEELKHHKKTQDIQLSILDYMVSPANNLINILETHGKNYHFVVVDTPGMTLHNETEEIIQWADTIICPINESFIDLEALKGSLFFKQLCILKNELVKNSPHKRNITIVTTRRSPIQSNHQEEIYNYLNNLKKIYHIDYIQGFYESISFKDLFKKGITSLDCSLLSITPSNIQKKSIDSIRLYIKYIIQKMLSNQNQWI
jgi:chromosome partitioning protein